MSTSSPRVVLCHGVFDLVHAGHVEHLRQAATFGDELVVSVVPDRFCAKRKPIYSEKERISILQAIRYVDKVILCEGPSPVEIIQDLRPAIYVRPIEYATQQEPENALLRRLGIPLGFTYPLPIHTSDIIARARASA